jgi:RimJ/RimL family protein N-acetyltransferase
VQIYLETERLIFRRLTEADVENEFALANDPAVMRFINGGKTTPREVIETERLPWLMSHYDRADGYGHWAAIEKPADELTGRLSPCSRTTATWKKSSLATGCESRLGERATPPRALRLSSTKASPS